MYLDYDVSSAVVLGPPQVYRDLLWDSPRPIRWVQGQMIVVIIRFACVLLLPPPLYRRIIPWILAAGRAVAPACLLVLSWLSERDTLGLGDNSDGRKPSDEHISFSLRWYPLMDVAFNLIHPVSWATGGATQTLPHAYRGHSAAA